MGALFRLVIKSGPSSGHNAEVSADLVLGRADADLNLPDPQISRRHAIVRPAAGGLQIEDLGSTNGTFVNGTRIQEPSRLASGDVIRLGQCSVEVESDDPPPDRTVVAAESVASEPVAQLSAQSPSATGEPPPQAAPPELAVPFSPPTATRLGHVATRRLGPTLLTFGAIFATAATLVLYFWLR